MSVSILAEHVAPLHIRSTNIKDVEGLDRLVNAVSLQFFLTTSTLNRARGGVVVKALRYKPEGREFDSRWCRCNFSVTSPYGCTMALGWTQSLTEMSTRCISWG